MIAAAALAALAATIPSVSLVHHAPERVEACLRLPSTHPRPNVFGRDRCQSTVRATQIRPVSELAGKLSALLHRPSHAEVVVRVDGVLRNVVKGDASKAAFCCSRASRSLLASKHSDSCWRRSTASAGVLSSASEPDVRCFSLFPFRGIQSREVRCLGLLFLDLPSLGIPVGRAAPAA